MSVQTKAVVPKFRDLPMVPGGHQRSSWGVFGPHDEIGTLNRLTPARIKRALTLVRDGQVFSLNWAIDLPNPALFNRKSPVHTVFPTQTGLDDVYDRFYPQASSQWDSLGHVRHPDHGFYNGRSYAQVTDPNHPLNGIDAWANRGIVGRFVLIDVARYLEREGTALIQNETVAIGVNTLELALHHQNVTLEGGDVVLVRFGWVGWYETLDLQERRQLAGGTPVRTPGLRAVEETAEWLWDHGVAAIGCDVPALEAMPLDKDDLEGFLHLRLIPLLGFAIAELLVLDDLAAACAADHRYDGLFTAAPLNARGGIGSPANALTIR
jgi:hypothetical protein